MEASGYSSGLVAANVVLLILVIVNMVVCLLVWQRLKTDIYGLSLTKGITVEVEYDAIKRKIKLKQNDGDLETAEMKTFLGEVIVLKTKDIESKSVAGAAKSIVINNSAVESTSTSGSDCPQASEENKPCAHQATVNVLNNSRYDICLKGVMFYQQNSSTDAYDLYQVRMHAGDNIITRGAQQDISFTLAFSTHMHSGGSVKNYLEGGRLELQFSAA